MAGLDMIYDASGFIQQYIERRIRELLEDPMNELQDPNWVQATLLFERAVAPCEEYRAEELYELAGDIVKKADQHNSRVVYQRIAGMYNEKIIKADSIDTYNLSKDIRAVDYEKNIENIKKWIAEQDKFKLEMENFMKR